MKLTMLGDARTAEAHSDICIAQMMVAATKSIAAKFMLLARHMSVEATPAPVGHPDQVDYFFLIWAFQSFWAQASANV